MLLAKVSSSPEASSGIRPLYLSKIEFDVKSQTVRLDISDRYLLHQRMMTLAPDGAKRGDIHFLYRLEPTDFSRTNSTGSILVQSSVIPDPARLPEGYRMVGTKDIAKPYSVHCKAGATFRMLLVASPSRVVSNEMGFEKKLRFLVRPEERLAWILRKAKEGGFQILEASGEPQVVISPVVDAVGHKGNQRIVYRPALFRMVIRVEDEKRFLETLESGIGRGKSFGMGLATIRRI